MSDDQLKLIDSMIFGLVFIVALLCIRSISVTYIDKEASICTSSVATSGTEGTND